MDVELWANFPNAFSSVATVLAAWFTRSWAVTLVTFFIAYAVADLIQRCLYSRFLKRLFPEFLGSWMISLGLSVACAVVLFRSGAIWTAVLQLVTVTGNWLKITDVLLLVLLPLRAWLMNLLLGPKKIVGEELALIRVLDWQARRSGTALNWGLYDEP